MKFLLSALIVGLSITSLIFGQVTVVVNTGPLQTGYVVVTPVAGTGEGLNVSEVFGEQIGANLFQASVLGSPLVTLTDVVVSVDPTNGSNTGVAIVNPNASAATVTLSLGNQQGAALATRTITIAAHQQISQFATELFNGDPIVARGVTGLMFINSDVPIGVVALAFSGGTFTALPVASQLSGNNVITASITTPTFVATTTPLTTTFNGVTIVPVTPATNIAAPLTPTFNGVPTPPTLLPPPVLPISPTTPPIPGSAIPLVTSTGPVTGAAFTTTPVSSFATTTQNVVSSFIFAFPLLIPGVGGPGASLLPQVATGGGWTSQITIANTSTVTQTVRADFFNSVGGPLISSLGSTVPNIVIPPGGVATLRL